MFLELSEQSVERLFRPATRTIRSKCKKSSDRFFFLQGDICFTKAKYLCCAFGLFQLQSPPKMIMLVMIRANISTLLYMTIVKE